MAPCLAISASVNSLEVNPGLHGIKFSSAICFILASSSPCGKNPAVTCSTILDASGVRFVNFGIGFGGVAISNVSAPAVAKTAASSAFICSAVGLIIGASCTLLAASSSGVTCVVRITLPASSSIEVGTASGVIGGTVIGSAAASGVVSGGCLAIGGVARLNATLVPPVRTPPPNPPLSPASINRTKLSFVKKFLF